MAGNEKPTTKMPFRAAESVSRFFLFEALRTGCEDLESQSAQLQSARDKAEKILIEKSPVEFEFLVQEILMACVKGLQMHAAVVEAVTETMGKDGDEDVGESKSSSLLVGQIKDAAAGVEQLRVNNAKKETSPPLPIESDFDSEPEVQSSKKPNAREPEESSDRKKTKSKRASNATESVTGTPSSHVLNEKPMKGKGKKLSKPSNPSKSPQAASPELNSPNPKPASSLNTPMSKGDNPINDAGEGTKDKSAKRKQPEPEPAPSLEVKDTELKAPKPDTDIPPTPPKSNPTHKSSMPSFDEEDINSEVDARLAAKELKRAKKKAQKKRKRDSVASEIFSPDPKAESEHATPLPVKKKARVDENDGDGKGKRQNVDDAPGGGRAKVKKQKTNVDSEKEKAVAEANKAKRRRSSGVAVTGAPVAAPEIKHKKRKVGSE